MYSAYQKIYNVKTLVYLIINGSPNPWKISGSDDKKNCSVNLKKSIHNYLIFFKIFKKHSEPDYMWTLCPIGTYILLIESLNKLSKYGTNYYYRYIVL